MPLTRGWLAGEIAARLAVPLSLAQMATTDDAGNLKEPLDDTLRMLGVDEGDLDATDLPDGLSATEYLALAKLVTLRAVRERLLGAFDITSEGTALRLNQRLQNVERLLKDAEAQVMNLFGNIPSGVPGDASGGIITLDLNYLSGPTRPVSRDFPWTTIGIGDG